MNKVCVFTCITGDYDNLQKLDYVDKEYDYICFTNNKNIVSDFWKIIYISEDLDNLTLARKIKILGHEVLKKYDMTIWLDGAVKLRKPLSTFISECNPDEYDMVCFNHSQRDCIYDEINACVYLYKENITNANKIYNFLEKEKYPKHNGLIESTVLVRKNNKEIDELMKLWFKMITNYSRRDQLSFDYCLWKKPIKIQRLDLNVFDNKYFVHEGHKTATFSKKYRVYFDDNKSITNLIEGVYTLEDNYYVAKIKLPIDCNKIEFIVSPYDYLLLNDIKTTMKYEYNCNIKFDSKIFYSNNSIFFKKKLKKGDTESIKFNFDVLNIGLLLDIVGKRSDNLGTEITNLNNEISKLINNINSLEGEKNYYKTSLDKIYNSKGYKLLNKFYKSKDLFKRK